MTAVTVMCLVFCQTLDRKLIIGFGKKDYVAGLLYMLTSQTPQKLDDRKGLINCTSATPIFALIQIGKSFIILTPQFC